MLSGFRAKSILNGRDKTVLFALGNSLSLMKAGCTYRLLRTPFWSDLGVKLNVAFRKLGAPAFAGIAPCVAVEEARPVKDGGEFRTAGLLRSFQLQQSRYQTVACFFICFLLFA